MGSEVKGRAGVRREGTEREGEGSGWVRGRGGKGWKIT